MATGLANPARCHLSWFIGGGHPSHTKMVFSLLGPLPIYRTGTPMVLLMILTYFLALSQTPFPPAALTQFLVCVSGAKTHSPGNAKSENPASYDFH